MRLIFALPLLALAACQVTTDDANDSITAQYNEDVAENALSDAGNLAGQVANDVEQSAEKIQEKADNVDVDVDVETDGTPAQANAN